MIPKFRAWDKHLKIMRNVKYIDFENRELMIYGDDYNEDDYTPTLDIVRNFDEFEIMQSIGLKDKNGVEIFEGDIVKAWSEGVQGNFQIKRRIDGLWLLYPAWKDSMFWYMRPTEDGRESCEIIGNIYENPELLEAEE